MAHVTTEGMIHLEAGGHVVVTADTRKGFIEVTMAYAKSAKAITLLITEAEAFRLATFINRAAEDC